MEIILPLPFQSQLFYFLFFPYALAGTSSTELKRSGFFFLMAKGQLCFSLSMMLAVGFSQMTFIMRKFPSIPSCWELLLGLMLDFIKWYFCTYWVNHEFFLFLISCEFHWFFWVKLHLLRMYYCYCIFLDLISLHFI